MPEIRYPGTFSIYKKSGAAQFTFMEPRFNENGRIDKAGAILLEVAEGKGEKSYAWKDKISFAFGMSDLCQVFDNPDKPPRLVHSTPNTQLMKNLEFVPGEGKYTGTYMMKIGEKSPESNSYKNVSVPLTSGEYTVLLRLFMSTAPTMIGWR